MSVRTKQCHIYSHIITWKTSGKKHSHAVIWFFVLLVTLFTQNWSATWAKSTMCLHWKHTQYQYRYVDKNHHFKGPISLFDCFILYIQPETAPKHYIICLHCINSFRCTFKIVVHSAESESYPFDQTGIQTGVLVVTTCCTCIAKEAEHCCQSLRLTGHLLSINHYTH